MTDPQCLAAVQLGYEAWNEITCSYLVWSFAGRTENQAWGSGDGENVVSWRESSWDDSPAALAITSSIFGGFRTRCKIPTSSLMAFTTAGPMCLQAWKRRRH